jgi:4-oxalocrotonate tautomerase
MPTLMLRTAPPQDAPRQRALAEALTRITAETLGKRPEVTAVLIDGLPPAQWFIGAQPVQRPTAWLEIGITAGTNTEMQKAAFIEAAFAELQHQLAPGASLEAASYVIVHELPASDWGYGGRTQQARRPAAPTLATPPPVP